MATPPDKERRKQLRDAYKQAQRALGPSFTALDYEQVDELLDYLEETLPEEPCDHTTRHAEHWAHSHGIDWPGLADNLREFGGYCDCEILLNIEPDLVFD